MIYKTKDKCRETISCPDVDMENESSLSCLAGAWLRSAISLAWPAATTEMTHITYGQTERYIYV